VSGSSSEDRQRTERTIELCRLYQAGRRAAKRLKEDPTISGKQRSKLLAEVEQATRAGTELVRLHYRLIVRLAAYSSSGQMRGSVVGRDDIMQLATIGFLRGIERYDASQGTRLSTFVQHTIREEIRHGLRDGVGLSGAHGGDIALRLRPYITHAEQEYGRVDPEVVAEMANEATIVSYVAILAKDPRYAGCSDDDLRELAIARATERGLWLTAEKVKAAQMRSATMDSLDVPVYTDEPDGATLADQMTTSRSAEDEVVECEVNKTRQKVVEDALQRVLPTQSYMIVRLFFGIGIPASMSAEQVAKQMGLTVDQVRVNLEIAIERLRHDPELLKLVSQM